MRFSFLFSLLFLPAFSPSCYSPPPERHLNTDSIHAKYKGDSLREAIRLQYLIGVGQRVDSLVTQNFVLKLQDFDFATYYHNGWWDECFLRTDGLTCVVDEYGHLYLINCLDAQDAGGNHNKIVVEIGANKDQYISDTASIHPDPRVIGNGNTEYAVFAGDAAWKIAEVIAKDKSETIFVRSRNSTDFVSKYELQKRDKDAIADCVELAKTLKQLYAK